VKTNGERPLTSSKIEKNIKALKGKLRKNTSQLYQHLFSGVNAVPISELTWKDPLANQVISDDSNLVQALPERLRESFMVKFFFHIQSHVFFDLALDNILIYRYTIFRNQ
jgi:dynactin complex subunit